VPDDAGEAEPRWRHDSRGLFESQVIDLVFDDRPVPVGAPSRVSLDLPLQSEFGVSLANELFGDRGGDFVVSDGPFRRHGPKSLLPGGSPQNLAEDRQARSCGSPYQMSSRTRNSGFRVTAPFGSRTRPERKSSPRQRRASNQHVYAEGQPWTWQDLLQARTSRTSPNLSHR
jgi:hypothetical protein